MLRKTISGGESGAKQSARRARLLSDGLSGGRQLVANELDLLGVANGDGLAQMVRQKELMRKSREAGGNFFIARAGHNPNNRGTRAMARTRWPYSSIDCGDPGQTGRRLLNFLIAYRPEVLHITGTGDFSKGRVFEAGVAAALEKVLRRAVREGLAEPALEVSA